VVYGTISITTHIINIRPFLESIHAFFVLHHGHIRCHHLLFVGRRTVDRGGSSFLFSLGLPGVIGLSSQRHVGGRDIGLPRLGERHGSHTTTVGGVLSGADGYCAEAAVTKTLAPGLGRNSLSLHDSSITTSHSTSSTQAPVMGSP
jgi:hypothetical protein